MTIEGGIVINAMSKFSWVYFDKENIFNKPGAGRQPMDLNKQQITIIKKPTANTSVVEYTWLLKRPSSTRASSQVPASIFLT